MTLRYDSPDELRGHVSPDVLAANPGLAAVGTSSTRFEASCEQRAKEIGTKKVGTSSSKYHARRTGHYASKKEAKYAAELKLMKEAGEIEFWLEQVPFRLPGGTTYRLDFLVFRMDSMGSWDLEFIEVKGMKIRLGEIKRHQVEEIYGIHIEVV